MDWLSFTLGFLTNFALIGVGIVIAAIVIAVRKSSKK